MKKLIVVSVVLFLINVFSCASSSPPEQGEKAVKDVKVQEKAAPKKEVETGEMKRVKEKKEDPYVYVTRTGKKYHREMCTYLRKGKIKILLSEAKRRVYKACSRCNPPQ